MMKNNDAEQKPAIGSLKELHQSYLAGHYPYKTFFLKLMDCVAGGDDIAQIMRCVPVNLFPIFHDLVSRAAAREGRTKIGVVGGVIDWTAEDARRVMQWLQDHPQPELAPDDGMDYDDDPNWEPPKTPFQLEREEMLRQGILPPYLKELLQLSDDEAEEVRLRLQAKYSQQSS